MLVFCLIASLFGNDILLTKASESTCADGYIHYEAGKTCIKIVDKPEPWDQAKATCEADNGSLLIIHNEEQNTFVNQKLNTEKFYWIGTRNENPEGFDFVNVDGKKMSYNNWKAGMPNNVGGKELCVMIYGNKRINSGDWNDYGCHHKLPFLCERVLQNEANKEDETGCGESYVYYPEGDTCIRLIKQLAKWDVAKSKCEADRGQLLVIHDEQENAFVTNNLLGGGTSYVWIGGENRNSEGLDFYTVDGKKMVYTNWRKSQPDNLKDSELCVGMYGKKFSDRIRGRWDDSSCNIMIHFLCERAPFEKEVASSCPEGWSEYQADDTCVKVFESRKNFETAREVCKEEGGDLVTIKDEKKNSFVNEKLGRLKYWIGLINLSNQKGQKGFDFAYLDDTKMGSYHPWQKGQPNNARNRQKCVLMNGNRKKGKFLGLWDDYKCAKRMGFVCEVSK